MLLGFDHPSLLMYVSTMMSYNTEVSQMACKVGTFFGKYIQITTDKID